MDSNNPSLPRCPKRNSESGRPQERGTVKRILFESDSADAGRNVSILFTSPSLKRTMLFVWDYSLHSALELHVIFSFYYFVQNPTQLIGQPNFMHDHVPPDLNVSVQPEMGFVENEDFRCAHGDHSSFNESDLNIDENLLVKILSLLSLCLTVFVSVLVPLNFSLFVSESSPIPYQSGGVSFFRA